MGDSDPTTTFGYLARECGKRGLVFLFAQEGVEDPRIGTIMRQEFGGAFIANQRLEQAIAEKLIELGEADAVCLGCS